MGTSVRAEEGITINAAEIGIGKFHRKDNAVHPYADDNAWKPYILGQNAGTKTPQIMGNKNGSYTIFFSNLDELMGAMEQLTADKKLKIKNFNLNAHGMPGHMWYPKDAKTQSGFGCMQWRQAASAEDQANYDQYYGPISKSDVMQMRALSERTSIGLGISCVSGLKEWQEMGAKHKIQSLFTTDAQIHFMSCIVGLGRMGDEFTKGIAQLILSGDQGRVQSSLMFGLGDWSMSEGMGFWDYQNDAQLEHDNAIYPKDRTDREMMQKGSVRTAGILNGAIASGVMTSRDFMFPDGRDPGTLSTQRTSMDLEMLSPLPESVRIPGTNVRVQITQ